MAKKLETYNKKRNFEKTAEPEGIVVKSKKKLRYVIQHHMARREHYDFRLEWHGTLLSWAVPKGPSFNPKDKRLAIKVEDHPFDYRNFEGTIPKGEYGGGTVMLWDEGYWEPEYDVGDGLDSGNLKLSLYGERLQGKWALIQIKKEDEKQDNWLLLKEKDEYVQTSAGISQFTTSIRTGRTMSEIEAGVDTSTEELEEQSSSSKKKAKTIEKTTNKPNRKSTRKKAVPNPFSEADVQLAKLEDVIPDGDEWIYEMKYDGYRILAFIEGDSVKLMTRNGHDYTERFASVADSIALWANDQSMVVDGEMVVVDEAGRTDFQALQNYLRKPGKHNLTYIIFDLLAFNGKDYRDKPLLQRKEKLEELMQDAPKNLHYSKHIMGKGKESFEVACQSGMEGIVGKRANASYKGTKNGDWIKLKCDNRQEFVIGGYTLTDKRTSGVSALLLGVYDGDEFIYTGRAGTGLSQLDMDMLEGKCKGLKKKQSSFINPPKEKSNETVTWLRPKLVAEIKFAEWTDENLLRQASFKGLRVDKDPVDVRRESS